MAFSAHAFGPSQPCTMVANDICVLWTTGTLGTWDVEDVGRRGRPGRGGRGTLDARDAGDVGRWWLKRW